MDTVQLVEPQPGTSTGKAGIDPAYQQLLVNNAVAMMMKQLLEQGCLRVEPEDKEKRVKNKFNKGKGKTGQVAFNSDLTNEFSVLGNMNMKDAPSEVTIYDKAIRDGTGKRGSTSSEDAVDTSDDLIDPHSPGEPDKQINLTQFKDSHLILTGHRGQVHQRRQHQQCNSEEDGAQDVEKPREITPEEHASQLIREAELSKARVMEIPGKSMEVNAGLSQELLHSVIVDEKYQAVASHVDASTKAKIERGDYVDFAKLIPCDCVMMEDDGKIHLDVKDGQIYPVSNNSSDSTAISSMNKWEQAFRVFLDIYTRSHPTRASQLIQYNHIIHSAAQSFIWDNVYMYDKDFRLHMSEYPGRMWGIILQQAWNLRLKEKHKISYEKVTDVNKFRSSANREICRRFNRGKCSYGFRCRFDHRCSYYFKLGHGQHNCRKAGADKQSDRYDECDRQSFTEGCDYNATWHTPEGKADGTSGKRK